MDSSQALEIERVVGAARDALTDEMVGRVAATAAEGMDLLDQVNRSGAGRALPALAQLVENGDLDRLVALARTIGAAQDALTDEMVGRVVETVSESMAIVDRLNRAGPERLVAGLERLAGVLESTIGALDAAKRDIAAQPAAGGGLGGLWQLLRDPESQQSLRFLLAFAKEFRKRSV
jgi:uncharacterized protein YjgD (DUF1641 family)